MEHENECAETSQERVMPRLTAEKSSQTAADHSAPKQKTVEDIGHQMDPVLRTNKLIHIVRSCPWNGIHKNPVWHGRFVAHYLTGLESNELSIILASAGEVEVSIGQVVADWCGGVMLLLTLVAVVSFPIVGGLSDAFSDLLPTLLVLEDLVGVTDGS
ncbi:hypothetical protein BP00DRAFT_231903 [Aspergillus indologenus CBS 114.80]|uniref:Uncharacterized protein n=1 Tax=Aspergillus indologenus CBS 114.80 TaxID=1450541 RepID=A0A2V5HYF5_9EURO|nr:hypothetical protein BP00DRAFT_231903 [Aspergillus indologenus CBS 114.80]